MNCESLLLHCQVSFVLSKKTVWLRRQEKPVLGSDLIVQTALANCAPKGLMWQSTHPPASGFDGRSKGAA